MCVCVCMCTFVCVSVCMFQQHIRLCAHGYSSVGMFTLSGAPSATSNLDIIHLSNVLSMRI